MQLHCIDISHFMYQLNGYLGGLHFLAITNNVVLHIHVLVFVWTYVFISLGYIPRNR